MLTKRITYYFIVIKKLLTQIKLTIDNIPIEQTDKTKFLGIIINQNLTETDHISLLKKRLVKTLVSSDESVRICLCIL